MVTVIMGFVAKLLHLATPPLSTRVLPRLGVGKPYFYYDVPTLGIGGTVLLSNVLFRGGEFSDCRALIFPRGLFSYTISSAILVLVLPGLVASKEKRISFEVKIDSLMIPVAFAEEVIWRYRKKRTTVTNSVGSCVGFALLHYPLGRMGAVAHMFVFAVVAEHLNSKFGVVGPILFHILYNFIQGSFRFR